MPFEALLATCLCYVALMFGVAYAADRAAAAGHVRWLDHPLVYTLSLSVYCSAWTFYGAVGYASRSGLEFATIYLGPTIVFTGAWWGLRRLVRVARMHHVTSVADLISARFGKSNRLAAIVTLIAVIASTPYIALQLQSVRLSFELFATSRPDEGGALGGTAMWVAGGLALFTILFGTRNLAADERHHGVVTAIALEALVKLVAFLALGVFVVWGLADGPVDVLRRVGDAAQDPRFADGWVLRPDRWTALILVSGAAILTLPRMFQVMVVEAADEDRLHVAGWAFPAYLFAMSFFVLPIAVMGAEILPEGANPDLYVLTLPAAAGQDMLALLVFLGGFSAATSMVVVCAIAVATMVSNHWLVPGWLALRRIPAGEGTDDLRGFVLNARRIAILAIMAAGWTYHQASGGAAALATMGLVAFTGMAQVLPAMLGGLLWRGANRKGAYAGICTGFALWMALIFLPSVGMGGDLPVPAGVDPWTAAVALSLALNTAAFIGVSIFGFPDPVERLQGLSFVSAVEPIRHSRMARGDDRAEPLLAMARRVWGTDAALRYFQAEAQAQGKSGYLPDLTPRFLTALERRLAGSIGSATAHAMIDRVAGGVALTVADLLQVADEAQRAKEETQRLEAARAELARTARQLREVNDKLTALSIQKDAFLGQISHELRTPMTSVKAFSEILKDPSITPEERSRFAQIIHTEAGRLTRILDDLLDLSVLEGGRAQLTVTAANLHDLITRALAAASATRPERSFVIDRDLPAEHLGVITDADRLLQVLINVIGNARKYCDAPHPAMRIRVRRPEAGGAVIDVVDNGSGIDAGRQSLIFEKFSRLNDPAKAGGAGLGLAICKEIMAALGGSISYLPGQGGAAFRVVLPARPPGQAG
ncbi:sensor histidine kinase [Paracoccus sp. 1_MG-2023]|uniref:sensor histidine kinase n=1 Tax=unclassified Paracoccus (in: a-proteobacteria) TaxID=2688777 RepID=UPI001C08BB84|nr:MULTISPECIES: sensor histidine kinase [unclassified Paracoccus (in: a-proteobacteria)]MBU2958482.1 sensor histidine kinase [Paracoccus sp. C2R09]MDO6668533.1 sensor histidine kinase [Paracoccus sp. 1_MG-2023]